jgi:Fic family protein
VVGNERTGGVYLSPKTLHDIQTLMTALIKWADSDEIRKENPLIVAPIVHLYFELIHPFWDGNGWVGRVLEAMILKAKDYRHAPFLMAKYYGNHIEGYFSLFNQCRRAVEKKDPNAHYSFVKFFLEGFLEVVEETKKRAITLVRVMASRDYFSTLLQKKDINQRQYAILLEFLKRGPMSKKELESQPWYSVLYQNRTSMTRFRDLNKLFIKELLFENKDGKLAVFRMP